MLSWLEKCLFTPTFGWFVGIFSSKVGQTDLIFGVQSGFISRSVRSQVSVCSGYDLCTQVNIQTDTYEDSISTRVTW